MTDFFQAPHQAISTAFASFATENLPQDPPSALSSLRSSDVWSIRSHIDSMMTPEAINQIPSLNSLPKESLRPGMLVRYRCMVQQSLNMDYYIGAYPDPASPSGIATGKYGMPMTVEVDPMSVGSTHPLYERLPLYCVPIPGEAAWFNQAVTPEPLTQISNGQNRKKRRSDAMEDEQKPTGQEELDTANLPPGTAPAASTASPNKRSANASAAASSSSTSTTTPNGQTTGAPTALFTHLNHPLSTLPEATTPHGPPVKVLIYDGLASGEDNDYKLNTVFEFVGILDIPDGVTAPDEDLTTSPFFVDEFMAHHPPGDLVPRLHALTSRPIHNASLYSPPPSPDQITPLRTVMVDALAAGLGGDRLAAEYMLANILSRVYHRPEPLCLGKLTMNVYGGVFRSSPTAMSPVPALNRFLQAVLPRSVYLPLSREVLEKSQIVPKKDAATNLLVAGALQLSEGTHLLVDETALQAGTLGPVPMRNIQALDQVAREQRLAYDFEQYQVTLNTDSPILVVSEGKTMLHADVVLPLTISEEVEARAASGAPPMTPESVIMNAAATTGSTVDALLESLRAYLMAARTAEQEIQEEVATVLQHDFVAARRSSNGAIAENDFHLWLTLARLIAQSFGEPTLTLQRWAFVKELEAERRRRTAPTTSVPTA